MFESVSSALCFIRAEDAFMVNYVTVVLYHSVVNCIHSDR